MTVEELLALPEDDTERWLVRGVLRERPSFFHDRFHGACLAEVGCELLTWLRQQPLPHGDVFAGNIGVVLRRDPDTLFGMDAAYLGPELAAHQSEEDGPVVGVPTLSVEILDVQDRVEEINERLDHYLAAGVPLVWLLDPHDRTVRVYRPDARPRLFNEDDTLTAEPHMPGFAVPVRRLFG